MTKIKVLELVGFRGARHPLHLDLTKDSRSVAVFGDNGSGKSTITDAVEWFFTGRVDHLWREDCQAQALRNVNLMDGDSSSVSVEFADGPPAAKRILNSKLVARLHPTSSELNSYLEKAAAERLILRHQELTLFVAMRKGEKRKYIAKIIGYDVVTTFRDTIQQTLNALKVSPDYVAAKKTVDGHKGELLKLAKEIITTEGKYYEALNSLIVPFELATELKDDASFDACQTNLKSRIKQEEKATRKIKLQALARKLELLKEELESLTTCRNTFLPAYHGLIKNVSELQKLHLGDFLRKGKAVLEQGDGLDSKCPFCLADADLDALEETVAFRIEQLETTRAKQQASHAAMNSFVKTLQEVSRLCQETHLAARGSPCSETFTGKLLELANVAKSHAGHIPTVCATFLEIAEDPAFVDAEKEIAKAIDAQKQSVEAAEAKEVLTHEEESIVDVLRTMSNIRDQFRGYQADTQTIEAFETQIRSLQKIFEEFVKVQTEAMQNALDVMSKDIRRFYNAMHPHENAEAVHLSIVGDEGVEFWYKFHGQEVHPPMKYLSESHLNSLGVALFLASVKLFNETSHFFVLDDIVSSFDIGHRRRLLRLLKDEFSDWQIILLTHEQLWFELIRREMRPGWILHEVVLDDENGVLLQPSPGSFRELVEQKRSRNEDIENDLRKLLELVLKEVCHNLEVKVAFRFNDSNEKRMPGELLSALKGTVNKKCASLKNHAVFSKLDGSAFIANLGSHDNTERLSTEDIELVLEDIDVLDGLFRCPDCNVVVSSEHYVTSTKTITCKCGKLSLAWKE